MPLDIFDDPFAPPRRRRRRAPQLAPEQEQGLLGKMGTAALSGISAVGNFLDIPGSMLRDTLSSQNPFDQLLSPFSSENRVTGRDMLRGGGMVGDEDTWGNFGGGLGTEILLDPLTYLSGGLSAAGKAVKLAGLGGDIARVAAKKAGRKLGPRASRSTTSIQDMIDVLPDAKERITRAGGGNIDHLMGKPLGGVARFKLPFLPEKILHRGAETIDKLGNSLLYNPLSRAAARVMDSSTMGRKTEKVQKAARELYRTTDEAERAARGEMTELARKAETEGLTAAEDSVRLRAIIERGVDGSDLEKEIAKDLADGFAGDLTKNEAIGMKPDAVLDDVVGPRNENLGFAPRSIGQDVKQSIFSGAGRRPLSVADPAAVRRDQFYKGFADGTEGVNELFMDPVFEQLAEQAAISGGHKAARKAALKHMEDNYSDKINRFFDEAPGDEVIDDLFEHSKSKADMEKPVDRFKGLVNKILENPKFRESGPFPNHPITDAVEYKVSAARRRTILRKVYDIIGGSMKGPDLGLGHTGSKTVRNIFDSMQNIDHKVGAEEILQRLGMPSTDDAVKGILDNVVDADVAEDLVGLWPAFKAPPEIGPWTQAYDNFTALFKVGVLTWPARYVRDSTSGLARNVEAGLVQLKTAVGSGRDAHLLVQGRVVEKAGDIPLVKEWLTERGMTNTPENATEALRLIWAQYGPLGHRAETDVGGEAVGGGLEKLLGLIPGRQKSTIPGNVNKVARTALGLDGPPGWGKFNPLNVRGFGGRGESEFVLAAAGDMVGNATDTMNRLIPFIDNLKKGVDPNQAMREINLAQVDYAPRAFTPTERQVLKRIMPFYSFTSRQIPYLAQALMDKPGGRLAQTLRGLNRSRGTNSVTPDYVSETASIPLGEQPDGSDRYLTGLGMMFEDPLSFLGGGFKGAGLEALSRMNPILKGPLEHATGQSFFQKGPMGGRPLRDLDPTIGRTLANITGSKNPVPTSRTMEFLIANSPLARASTSLRQATDPRKGLGAKAINLGTGMRLSDISPAAQDAIIRERAAEEMKKLGGKTFRRTFIPEDVLLGLPQGKLDSAMRFNALMRTLSNRAKGRKEAKRGN